MKGTEAQHEADLALGRRLRSLRVTHGVTQTALGAVLGVSYQQIQKYESGESRLRVSQLRRIAEAFGVSATELFEIPRTETSDITDMIDTTLVRRLIEAFQRLTSGERRCLAALAEEMAARR
jgi:transcriptional regulator with XRE-family HTH domain